MIKHHPAYCSLTALACCALLALPLSAAWQSERTLSSPDSALTFLLERDDTTGALAWSVTHASRPVVTRGALGIEISGTGVVADEGAISRVEERSVNTTWKPPYGERSTIPDHFREEILTVSHAGQGSLLVKLQVRAYNEGIAFRYLVRGSHTLTVSSEKTTFPLPEDTTVWTSPTAQGKITEQPVTAIKGTVERPLTAKLAPDLFAAFGEAALMDQARMKFALQNGSNLRASLDGGFTVADDRASAWRYVRAGHSPGALLEGNHFLLNLNEPQRIGDTSWLRPGKVLREVTLTTKGALACIDYAAAHHLQFIMFDSGWYGHENDEKESALAVNVDPKRSPGPLDLPRVIAAARSKNIGVILYVNRRALEKQLDEILPLYQKWGVAGIKFGFVQTGSQQGTTWLHDAIARSAKHQLMVNVHDEYRMTGVERTLPNFMTAEGVRGDEETSKNEEVLNTLFTRGLAGATDQTNCYFAPRTGVMGSHASQLAKAVCIYSPWQSVFWYDRPPLQDVPEIGFFERLPTVWDETRVLEGYPGSHAVLARRSGGTWFLGALNGTTPREFQIPLNFLETGKKYRLEQFTDDPAVQTSTRVRIETSVVTPESVIRQTVATRQGLAAIITQEPSPARPIAKPRTEASAITPAPFRMERHALFLQRKTAGPVDLLFLGDSITEWWPRNGKEVWQRFAPHAPANFGVASIRTEGLLWNITHGELDGLRPKVAVILVGVNNILQYPEEKPEWVAGGIRKIVGTVREKLPETKILLLGIFPARNPATHPARERIAAVNRLIAGLDDGRQVRFLDLGSQFLDAGGNVRTDLAGDALHPNARGYAVWYEAMQPVLQDLLGE